jgi:hypothetical protein
VNTNRAAVVQALRSQGEHDKALQAACVLPQQVDLVEDASLLSKLGVHPADLQETASSP